MAATYTRDQLPHGGPDDPRWAAFRKRTATWMVRIDGPFVVETDEGPLRCEDGWLALDARGYPYPIAADEHQLIYEPIEEEGTE
ncbi:MAG: hypothetical protein AAF547_02600 [Actinomycetota bacterium]